VATLARSHGVTQYFDPLRLCSRVDVVGFKFLNRPLGLCIGEPDLFSGDGLCEIECRSLGVARLFEQSLCQHWRGIMLIGVGNGTRLARARSQQVELSPRAAANLKVIPRLIGKVEGHRSPRDGIAVPVRQLKVVPSSDEARTVEDARPGCLRYAVRALPPPPLQIVCIVNLNLAYSRLSRRQRCRNVLRGIPAVSIPPFGLRCGCPRV